MRVQAAAYPLIPTHSFLAAQPLVATKRLNRSSLPLFVLSAWPSPQLFWLQPRMWALASKAVFAPISMSSHRSRSREPAARRRSASRSRPRRGQQRRESAIGSRPSSSSGPSAKMMVTIYSGYCPLGSGCSKKGSCLGKAMTVEKCRDIVKNHLMMSTYHELAEEDAESYVDTAEFMESQEPLAWWTDDMSARKKSKGSDSVAVAVRPRGALVAVSTEVRDRASQVAGITFGQLDACVDSLRRAHNAAEASAALCIKAAKAFQEEAKCIKACCDVLESFAA